MSATWDDIAESFRRRIRRIVAVRGIAWVGIVLVGVLWTVGFIDWALHLSSHWVRFAAVVGIVVAFAVTVWRTLLRPLTARLSDVDIARTIEQNDSAWGDRLASAAQFRTALDDQQLGSTELQQAVVSDVDARLSKIDLQQVIDPTSTKRLVGFATFVCFAGVVGALWHHEAAVTALSRIALPFAEISWPRTTEFHFLDADLHQLAAGTQRTTAGEPFPMYLENRRGELPENVVLELRFADGRTEERTLQSTVLWDETGLPHEVGIATLTAHQGPLQFRAVGGDDTDMVWRTLDVMPAPALANITVTITPPSYTELAARTLNGAGAVEALIGSQIHFAGRANKPLASAWLRREGQPPQEMALNAGRQEFTTEFVIRESGQTWFWFELTDEYGLGQSNAPRYELRGIVDRKPTVYLDQPAGDITVTPDAEVLIRIVAQDDLGIESLSLVHSQTNDSPARSPLKMSIQRPTAETIELLWNLTSLGLRAGDRMTYHAEAIDAFDLPQEVVPRELSGLSDSAGVTEQSPRPVGAQGQVGISAHRHIDVLSTEEKRQELAMRQLKVLDSLQELQDRQSQTLETTAGLRIQAELADQLQSDDLDLLKQSELEQLSIREQLSDAQSGVVREVETIQQELSRNQIDDPEISNRLDRLSLDLQNLTQDLLPTVEQSLARARKLSQSSTEESHSSRPEKPAEIDSTASGLQQQLKQAEEAQTSAVAVMKQATTELGNWQRQYEVLSALDKLIVDQSDIHHQSQEVGRETLTKRPEALTSQQQADLARLSDRQRRLADRLGELISRGTENNSAAVTPSPAIDAMQEALRRLAERRTTSQMHNAAESLKRNDIAQTAESQQQVLNDLRNFGELLNSTGENAAETQLLSITEQAEEVETLKKRQEQLARSARHAMGPTADSNRDQQLQKLIKHQEQLAQRTEELALQLRRQQNHKSAQSAGRAARRMREAQQGIEQQQPQETADSQQDALEDLQQLADELVQRQREVEQQLARQQIEQLVEDLQSVADVQQVITTTTIDLDKRQQQRGSWSRMLRKELRETADKQTALAERIDGLRTLLSDYPVIDMSLEQAANPMRAAASRLGQSDVSAATVAEQRLAQQRLLSMIDVARQSSQSQEPQASNIGPQPATPPPNGQGQQLPQLLGTQLRLLRLLQAEVQSRTNTMADELQSGNVDAEAIATQRESLARDQDRIADSMRQLLEQFTENPEQYP